MMRSLYSGVAGLKTHQTKMDVIGNNIANVNTTAFKASSVTFSELMSQTTQNASGPNPTTGVGGTLAKQIGLGVKAGAIKVDITSQGASQSTGNPFDVMITGENFFIVNNGKTNYFTRDGSFYVDGVGNLAMTSTGYNVMGWGVDDATGQIKKDTVSALRIMNASNMTYPPEATSNAYISGILDKNDSNVVSANGKAVNMNFYDSLGYSYTAKFVFKQSDDSSNYSIELDKIINSAGEEVDLSGVKFGQNSSQKKVTNVAINTENYTWNGNALTSADGTVTYAKLEDLFDGANLKDLTANTTITKEDGSFVTVGEALDAIATAYNYEGSTEEFLNLYVESDASINGKYTIEELLSNLKTGTGTAAEQFDTTATSFETQGRVFTGATISFNPDNGEFAGIGGSETLSTIKLDFADTEGYGNFGDIEIDFSKCSMFDNKGTSTLGATTGDADGMGTGRRLGEMIGVSIQNNGMIYASYDNGMTKLLGQIATADFANASGLEKAGDNLYSATLNSGDFDGIGADVTANGGYMSTGQLEMSNVDLSKEFTEMITTQRGFQANSRIITTSDTMLEELTNLKR